MKAILRDIRDFFVSLKLTVALLVLGMLLIFAATLDQTNLGIWGIQQKWFRTFVVFHEVRGVALPLSPYAPSRLLNFSGTPGAHSTENSPPCSTI